MIDSKALFEYIDSGTVPKGPLTVHIDIINSCNLNCITCWNHSPLPGKKRNPFKHHHRESVMLLETFKEIISDLEKINVKKIIISGGGEPFCHHDIYAMIKEAKTAGFHVTVLTNATLIDEERLLVHPPDTMLVNLGAATAAVYAEMHPGKNIDYQHLVTIIQSASKAIRINLLMVVSRINYREILSFARLACGFPGISLSYKRAKLFPGTHHLELGEGEIRETKLMTEQVRILCSRESGNSGNCRDISNNLDVFESELDAAGRLSSKNDTSILDASFFETGCYAGIFYSRIYVNGDVFFCCAHIKVGNIAGAPFSAIWESTRYNSLRKRLAGRGYFPCCSQCGKYNLNFRAFELIREKAESKTP